MARLLLSRCKVWTWTAVGSSYAVHNGGNSWVIVVVHSHWCNQSRAENSAEFTNRSSQVCVSSPQCC